MTRGVCVCDLNASLVDSYANAVRLIADQVRGPMRLRESHGPFSNPEGADFEVTLEHLQPWEDRAHRALQHSHAFHMRYYHTALEAQGAHRVALQTRDGVREFYRVAASAHYEVEHTNPNHADVEMCPICGRTGEYADLRGNLVELVHDPLGVELLLHGTIRGEVVLFEHDQQPVGGIQAARDRFLVEQRGLSGDGGRQKYPSHWRDCVERIAALTVRRRCRRTGATRPPVQHPSHSF